MLCRILFIGSLLCCAPASYAQSFNVRTQPAYVFVGILDIAVDIALTEHLSLAPTLKTTADFSAQQWGIEVIQHRPRFSETGWRTHGHVQYGAIMGSFHTQWKLTVLSSHQWRWDTFNLALGIGPEFTYEREDYATDVINDNWRLWPTARLSVGWFF